MLQQMQTATISNSTKEISWKRSNLMKNRLNCNFKMFVFMITGYVQ